MSPKVDSNFLSKWMAFPLVVWLFQQKTSDVTWWLWRLKLDSSEWNTMASLFGMTSFQTWSVQFHRYTLIEHEKNWNIISTSQHLSTKNIKKIKLTKTAFHVHRGRVCPCELLSLASMSSPLLAIQAFGKFRIWSLGKLTTGWKMVWSSKYWKRRECRDGDILDTVLFER